MEITSSIGLPQAVAAAIAVATLAAAIVLAPLPAVAQRPKREAAALTGTAATTADGMKDCVITDKNGRQWPCSRAIPSQGAVLTTFTCNVEDRMGNDDYSMFFYCDDSSIEWWVDDGDTAERRDRWGNLVARTGSPRVTCQWRYAGNIMSGVLE